MLRKQMIMCAAALCCCGWFVVETASAGAVGTCDLTGYTFMGVGGIYASTPEGPNVKDYFLGQPVYHDDGGSNYGGYGWTKFAVGTDSVDSAYLIYDLVGVGSMSTVPPTPECRAYLDLYLPGEIDVADLDDSPEGIALCETLLDDLAGSDSEPVLDTIVMAYGGKYCVDITDLYNGWATGAIDNHGLVFSAPDDMGSNAGRYASFGNASGDAPRITSVLSGDANLDGSVNGTDLNAVLSNYNASFDYHAWAMGDFNADGSVNGTDLNAVLSNYNQSVSSTIAVPEPSMICLAGAALIGLGLARILRHRRPHSLPSARVVLVCGICLASLFASVGRAGEAKTAPDGERKIGVLLVSHGSRSDSWRKMLMDIENAVRDDVLRDGRIAGLRSAFMEYKEPSIATQLKEFDREGYSDVIVVPLLLTVSSHSFDDIPTIIGQKEDRRTTETLRLEGIEIYKPKASMTVSPLLDFPAVLEKNISRRVKAMSAEPSQEGVVIVAYGSEPYEDAWSKMLDRVKKKVASETGIDCVQSCWCGHIVRYKSEPTAKTIREVLAKKQRALVVPALVAVDEMFQGKIIGGAIKQVNQNDRIVYRHDAILPDENVNHWVVDIARKMTSQLLDAHETTSVE